MTEEILDEIFSEKNIVGDTLVIPKGVKILYKDFGERLRTAQIKHIRFEEGSKFLSFQDCACANCLNLESLDFTNCQDLYSIELCAFSKCKNLKEVVIPQNCKLAKIGGFAFAETGLTSFEMPNSNLEKIGKFAFGRCLNLKTIDLHGCKKLSCLEKDALNELNLQMLDLGGCSGIRNLGFSRVNTKNAKVSADILGDFSKKNDFSYQLSYCNFFPYGTNIQVVGRKGVEIEFDSLNGELANLEITKTGLWKFAKDYNKNADPKILVLLLYNFFDKQDYKNLMSESTQKYYQEINKKLEAENSICEIGTSIMFYKLGALGIKFDSENKENKNLEISYKNILAKEYLKIYPDENLEKIKDKEQYFIEYQRKINKIARSVPLDVLVGEFLLNKVAIYGDVVLDLSATFVDMLPRRVTDLNFASFFVLNFDEILDMPKFYIEEEINDISLAGICNNFQEILENSHKKVITRSNRNRLTLKDCSFKNVYGNVFEGNEELASLCGEEHISSEGFDFLQDLFEKGKEINDYQILTTLEDDIDAEIHYEYIEKDNPLGLVLGNKTNCCQAFGEFGQDCMIAGETDPACGFVAFWKEDELIGQSWVWFDAETHTIALDNIEVPEVYQQDLKKSERKFVQCINRLAKNFKLAMEENGNRVDNVIIGAHASDLPFLEKYYHLEMDFDKLLDCPVEVNNKKCYTDILRAGQFIVMKNGNLANSWHKHSFSNGLCKQNDLELGN